MIIAVDTRCLRAATALVLLSHAWAWADTGQDLGALRQAAARFVGEQVRIAYPATGARVEVGPIDPRLMLPACPKPGFELSSGSSLWGSGTLAVRCEAPRPWSLYVTYRTVLKGPALLARRPLPAGTAPGPDDLSSGTVDYDSDPGRYPRDPGALHGAVLTRPLAKDAPLTVDMLRIRPIIRPGQRVRVVIDGSGFQISQEGIAQAQAGVGDSLRLKTASGRYVVGVVQPDGSVRIQP